MVRLLMKSAVRLLRKHATLSIVKIAGLAIGMATFLITALYCRHEWSFDKQHPGWEKIYRYVHRVKSADELQSFAFTSATTGPALRETCSEVEDFTRVLRFEVSLKRKDSDVGFVEKNFAFADANFLQFFSYPVRGGHDHGNLNGPYAVIVTPASAEKYFGGMDPVGQTLLLNGEIEIVVKGVFQTNFSRTHMNFDFVASFATLEAIKHHPVVSQQIPASLNLEHKGFNAFYTYLRLTSAAANETLEEKLPAFIEDFRGKGRSERLKPTLQSLASIHLTSDLLYEIDKNGSRAIVLIYIIVGCLILITAIINYVNISTAEFLIRSRIVGLKKILGINKGALLLGHLVEIMLLCAVALVLGGIVSLAVIPSFNSIMQTQLKFFSGETILPFLVVYAVTVVLSAFLPAIQISRQDALVAFRGNWKAGTSSAHLRNMLVFLQLMVSFVLLALALLIVRQTDYLLHRDTGFDSDQVIVVNAAGIHPNQRIAFKHKLMTQESVANAAMCSTPPGESLFTFGVTLPGASGDEDRRITFYHMFVDENFLGTLGVDIHEGRFFDSAFPADSLKSFVVNQAGAAAIDDAVMSHEMEIPNIYTGKPSRKTVVGIINDFHFASFHTAVEPLILEYNPRYARYLLLRFHPGNAKAVITILDRMWREEAPLLPLDYYFPDASFAKHYATEQRTKHVVVIVSLLAVCLACLGIFGTSLFAMQQRTKEIGVRKLLGSATQGLLILLFRPIFMIFLAACAIGIPIVIWAGERWLAHYPYRTDLSISILLMSFTVILLVIAVTIGSYLFKIVRIQPAEVLRSP